MTRRVWESHDPFSPPTGGSSTTSSTGCCCNGCCWMLPEGDAAAARTALSGADRLGVADRSLRTRLLKALVRSSGSRSGFAPCGH